MATRHHWLIKSEPTVYPYDQLAKDGRTDWTGIRNFEARNNLRAMKVGDLCLFYHSNIGKAVVGVARVLEEAGPDPTAPDENWASVVVGPVTPFVQPVDLATIKGTAAFADFALVTKGRISVIPVGTAHFKKLLTMGKTKLPA